MRHALRRFTPGRSARNGEGIVAATARECGIRSFASLAPVLARAILFTIFLVGSSHAQTHLAPDLMNYEASLTDAGGSALPDGNYDIEFSIYDAATTGTVIWGPVEFDGEGGTGHGEMIPLSAGRFSAVLGPEDTSGGDLLDALQSIAGAGTDAFLEITVEGVAMAPRQLILSAPFAMAASNGFPRGAIVMWFGGSLPAGWAFCDGSNGTPDLVSRFVKGAAGLGPYSGGGSSTHSHTTVSHAHTMAHTHSTSHTHGTPSHTHRFNPPNTTTTSVSIPTAGTGFGLVNFDFSRGHSHTVNIAAFTSGGSSSNGTGFGSIGASAQPNSPSTGAVAPTTPASNHEPLNYTLAFIMKL